MNETSESEWSPEHTLRLVRLLAWPVAAAIAAAVAGITIASVSSSTHENDTRVECVRSGGELGQENGWPTCTHETTTKRLQ